jgi:LysM repeat protein
MITKRAGWLILVAVLILTACNAQKKETPLPTLANYDSDLATHSAQLTASPSPPPTVAAAVAVTPTSPPSPTETPTEIPSETPTAAPTVTASPSVTPSPTVLSTAQIEATGIALTNTAIAQIMAITQTVETIRGATATAIAAYSPTPSPTATPTPKPEPFQVIFYTNRNGNDDIYLMTLNGVERALIRTAANEREPSCSPDGRTVIYASDATGSYQIYRMAINGTIPVQVTNTTGMNFAPTFNPDGSQIAFVSTRNNGIPAIWVMNADGSSPHQITTGLGRATTPSWGPGGRQLLFSSDQFGTWDLFLTILEDNVEGEFPVMPPGFSTGNQLWPVFDALGERIAYSVWDNLENPQTADIYLLDFEQPQPVPVRTGPGADIAWAWGDDTHLLASVGGPDDVQIALVDITTREAVRLTHAGTFNGGAHLCTVDPGILPPEPAPPASPTPRPTPSPTPTETPAPTPTKVALSPELLAAQKYPYVVQPGDTLMSISSRYRVKWEDVAAVNRLPNPDRLSVGQRIEIPILLASRPILGYRARQIDIGESPIPDKAIIVELGSQLVKAYENGRLVKTVSVSTGLPDSPTVTGTFTIYAKHPFQTMSGPGYFLPDVPYVMYFFESYGLHGTYWHNKFGQPMSHGCVNLPTEDAKWLYNWAEIGTPVLVKE